MGFIECPEGWLAVMMNVVSAAVSDGGGTSRRNCNVCGAAAANFTASTKLDFKHFKTRSYDSF
jgi:hypothetical protein